MSRWISVKKLPNHFASVLACSKQGRIVITWVDRGTKKLDEHFINEDDDEYTHWMPLPPLPTKLKTN